MRYHKQLLMGVECYNQLTFSKPFFSLPNCCPINVYHFLLVDYVQIFKKFEPNLAIYEGGLLKGGKIVAKLFFSRELETQFRVEQVLYFTGKFWFHQCQIPKKWVLNWIIWTSSFLWLAYAKLKELFLSCLNVPQ